jgi:hypothetical protein
MWIASGFRPSRTAIPPTAEHHPGPKVNSIIGEGADVAFLDTDRFARDVKGGLNLIAKIREPGVEVLFGDIGRYRDDSNFEL